MECRIRYVIHHIKSRQRDQEPRVDLILISEIAYVLKYPVQKVCEGESMWFIRQGGVYHQHNYGMGTDVWLLIFPNAQTCSSEEISDLMTAEEHPLSAHLALYFSRLGQWRWYMSSFETKLELAVRSAFYCLVDPMTEIKAKSQVFTGKQGDECGD